VNKITDESTKIAQFETTFRDHALQWYMKCKSGIPTGQKKTLDEINQDLIKEFENHKLEQQCIAELKERK
jgi:hypothetical protein